LPQVGAAMWISIRSNWKFDFEAKKLYLRMKLIKEDKVLVKQRIISVRSCMIFNNMKMEKKKGNGKKLRDYVT